MEREIRYSKQQEYRPPHPGQAARAFTLLELLSAIAIIAVLSALLLASTQQVRRTAQTAGCLGKLRQLGLAGRMFSADNNGFLPYRVDYDDTANLAKQENWTMNMAPYLGIGNASTSGAGNTPMTDVFRCPGDPSQSPRQYRTYKYNQSFPTPGNTAYARANYIPNRVSDIASPSRNAMLFCVAYTGPRQLGLWFFDLSIWGESADSSSPPTNPGLYPRPHYDGKAVNILYYDGHAAAELYPLSPATYHFDVRN